MVDWLGSRILRWTLISENFKVLRLQATFHHVCCFVYEYSEKGPGYSYVLSCSVANHYAGHVTGIAFCLYLKSFKKRLFNRLECWLQELFFLMQKICFHCEKLAISCNNYTDTISFLPPHTFNSLTLLNKNLISGFQNIFIVWIGREEIIHIAIWTNSLECSASISSIRFLSKGGRENWHVAKIAWKVANLELLCPNIEHLSFNRENPFCDLHSATCPKRQKNHLRVRRPNCSTSGWSMNNSRFEKTAPPLLQVNLNLSQNLIVYSC